MKKIKKSLIFVALLLFLLVFGTVGFSGYLLYAKGWEDKTSLAVSKVIPYPAIVVNFRTISFAEYRNRGVDFTKNFYTQTKGPDYLKSDEGKAKLAQKKRELLDIIIEEEFINEYAAHHRLYVSDGELGDGYKKLVAENGGAAAFERSLKEDYRWTIAYFKKILRTNLLRQKISDSLCNLDSATVKERAEEIKKQLSDKPASFEDLVSEFSEDSATAIAGGRLPAFSPDGLTSEDQQVEKAIVEFANNSKKGDVAIVKTCQGYSVAKLIDKNDKSREVAHILLKVKSYEDLLDEFREKSKILILLPEFYYNHDQRAVLPRV